MGLRRGFKSEAHEIARDVRAEMQLPAHAPLDMFELAEHLAIPLVKLSSYRTQDREAVTHFARVESGAFSGVTVYDGVRRLIVYNDYHAPTRQASDLAHECAHALLQHVPQSALDAFGCRNFPAEIEEEADWLAGALLVSEEAALRVARRRMPLEAAAAEYHVSAQMMRFRLNVTGAAKRMR